MSATGRSATPGLHLLTHLPEAPDIVAGHLLGPLRPQNAAHPVLQRSAANWRALGAQIAETCRAEPVHSIGQVACFYRRNPERTVIDLPKR